MTQESGFTSGTDALLLAAFVRQYAMQGQFLGHCQEQGAGFVELGCGDGLAMSLVASHLQEHNSQAVTALGVDVHKPALELAVKRGLGLGLCLHTAQVDVEDRKSLQAACTASGVDKVAFVMANPPYYKAGAGRVSKNPAVAKALHQDSQKSGQIVPIFCRAARALLPHHGWFFSIYSADTMLDMVHALQETGFGVRALMPIHTRPAKAARWVLFAARKDAATDISLLPSVCLYARPKGNKMSRAAVDFCPWLIQ